MSGLRAVAGRASGLLAGGAGRMALVLAAVVAVLALPTGVASALAASPAPAAPRAVVILLDVNLSLPGPGLAAECREALRYSHALPADVRVGLIRFGDTWHRALWPTTNRGRLAAALAASQPAGVTSDAIPHAIANATAVLRDMDAVASRLVVFSDGEGLVGVSYTASVPTDVVARYYESDDNTAALRALASSSGGHLVTPGRVLSLAAAFPPLPPSKAPTPAAPASGTAAAHHGGVPTRLAVPMAALFVALVLAAMMIGGTLNDAGRRRSLTGQIENYGPRRAPSPAEAESKVAGAAVRWMTWLLRSRSAEQGLAQRLDLAGIARKPGEWALLCACACVALSALLTVLTRNPLSGVLIGVPACWLATRLVLAIRADRRRAAFGEQLPNVLQLMASSLQSGFSLAQSLDAVVREDQQPTAGEFSRALAEARLGASLEDALDGVADRMESDDLRWVVMAVRIQREVGGNLAEVLRNTVGTMRERAHLRGHVKALTAEGRLSAYILIALPILIGGWLFYSSPSYMRPLYTTSTGLLMLIGSVVLMAVGGLWMRALIKVEV